MTTAADIRAAAGPIAQALGAVQDHEARVPPVDVLISFTHGGLVLRVADRSAAHRGVVEAAFRTAFTEAGWSVGTRHSGGLSMDHPWPTLTRPTAF